MVDVIIGRHAWNCQIRTHIHMGYTHTRKKWGFRKERNKKKRKDEKKRGEKKEENERKREEGKKKKGGKRKREGGGFRGVERSVGNEDGRTSY